MEISACPQNFYNSSCRKPARSVHPFRHNTGLRHRNGRTQHLSIFYRCTASRGKKKLSKSELPSRTWPNAPRPSSWPTRYLRPISAELRPGSETCLVASSCELEADRRERLTAWMCTNNSYAPPCTRATEQSSELRNATTSTNSLRFWSQTEVWQFGLGERLSDAWCDHLKCFKINVVLIWNWLYSFPST